MHLATRNPTARVAGESTALVFFVYIDEIWRFADDVNTEIYLASLDHVIQVHLSHDFNHVVFFNRGSPCSLATNFDQKDRQTK